MEDDSILKTDHRVAHAAAQAEFSQAPETQVANSPYSSDMRYNDIVNVIADVLCAKGLPFWKTAEALHEEEDDSRRPNKVFERVGFLSKMRIQS